MSDCGEAECCGLCDPQWQCTVETPCGEYDCDRCLFGDCPSVTGLHFVGWPTPINP